jgi:hypothetical protein
MAVMEELRASILRLLLTHNDEHPDTYTYVSSILSNLHHPYDMNASEAFSSLHTSGLIEVLSTTNIRIRLTDKGLAEARKL